MIIVRLSDGLGAQMFQYAFGRQLGIRSGQRVKYDVSWFEDRDQFGGTDRSLTLDEFNTDLAYATGADRRSVLRGGPVGSWLSRHGYVLERIPRGPQLTARWLNYYWEVRDFPDSYPIDWPHRRLPYLPILDVQGDGFFDGYWYSHRYFEDIPDVLRDDFSVPRPLTGKDAEVSDRMEETTSVSIHVRRDDKLGQGPEDDPLGNALPLNYFEKAAAYIADRVVHPHYFVFSDDPDWIASNIELDHPVTYVTHNDGSTDYIDLTLMSRCDHYVMANSGFSWWAAWLNPSEDKIVVVPKPWTRYGYPDGSIERWDFLPEDWVRMEYDVHPDRFPRG